MTEEINHDIEPLSQRNVAPLSYWRACHYRSEDIDEVCREIDREFMAARVAFNGSGDVTATVTRKTWERQEGHYPTMINFFRALVAAFGAQSLKGSIMVWLEDGLWEWQQRFSRRAPILAFGRRCDDYNTFLIPDPGFLEAGGYKKDLKSLKETEISWEKKIPSVFWRGAATGLGIEGERWQETGRVRLTMLAKRMNDASKLDAKISRHSNITDAEHLKRFEDAGILGEYCPFSDFLNYRYQIDVEGYCCAWMSFFLKLASHSVTLKVQGDHEQWFYDRLVPWVHYVPVSARLQELPDLINWLQTHDEACRNIALNANAALRPITFEHTARQTVKLIEQIMACQRES